MNKFLSVSVAIYSLKEFILFFYPFRNNFTISNYSYSFGFGHRIEITTYIKKDSNISA